MHVGLVVFVDVDGGLDMANLLQSMGVSVSLYLSYAGTAAATNATNGLDEHALEERVYSLGLLDPSVRLRVVRLPRLRDPRSLPVMRGLSRTMHADGADVAHLLVGPGEIWVAVLAWLLRGMPVVSTMIIPEPNVGEHLHKRVVLAINRLLALVSDLIVVNGARQVARVQQLYRIAADRVAYVPLSPRTTAARWPSQNTEESGTVLFLGAARRHKGLEYLVRAQPLITHQIPHARIVIASYGEDMERCRRMIQDSSKFEIHEGFVPGDEMAALLRRASVVALPYLSASTSGILNTALVFGKPVVATHVGCLPEYIEDGVNGLLVAPADVTQLAGAIARLLSDDALRHRMGENAAQWARQAEKETGVQSLRVYEQAISIHRNGRQM